MVIIRLQDYELDLKQIKPKNIKKSDKYSKAIYKYLKDNPWYRTVWFDESYYDVDTDKWIKKSFDPEHMNLRNLYFGMPEKENSICINGKCINDLISDRRGAQQTYCYIGFKNSHYVEVTKDFFDKYIEIGRCIYGHNVWINNEENRYAYIDNTHRKCNWCGQEQYEKTIVHKYESKVWKDY